MADDERLASALSSMTLHADDGIAAASEQSDDEHETERLPTQDELRRAQRFIDRAVVAVRRLDYQCAIRLFEKAIPLASEEDAERMRVKVSKLRAVTERMGPDGWVPDDEAGVHRLPRNFELPSSLYHKLFPHQREGVRWLWRLHNEGTGGILGDEMGLGKTIQVVTFLHALFSSKRIHTALIVMPKVVLTNWEREIKRWSPETPVRFFHGGASKDRDLATVRHLGGVCLTTYGMVRTSVNALNNGGRHQWDYIILDEGHAIKNRSTQSAKQIREIDAVHRIILTGTPVQNSLGEMWALFDFVCAGSLLGTYREFRAQFEGGIIQSSDREATIEEKHLGEQLARELRSLIEPYFLRREKRNVFPHESGGALPAATAADAAEASAAPASEANEVHLSTAKHELIVWTKLAPAQEELYRKFLTSEDVRAVLNETASPLAAITVLRTLCNHPNVLPVGGALIGGARPAAGGGSVRDTIALSGKLQFVAQLLPDLVDAGHRVLIFSQSKKMLDIIQRVLQHLQLTYVRIDGDVADRDERQELIERFNRDADISCFLLTIEVGGIGINLSGADRVILFEPNWNPAKDAQAVDRAYRMGQTRDVVVYRLNTCGTVEEKVFRKQVFKNYLMRSATIEGGNTRYFTQHELRDLFTLDDPAVSQTHEQLRRFHNASSFRAAVGEEHVATLLEMDCVVAVDDFAVLYSQAEQLAALPEGTPLRREARGRGTRAAADENSAAEANGRHTASEKSGKPRAPAAPRVRRRLVTDDVDNVANEEVKQPMDAFEGAVRPLNSDSDDDDCKESEPVIAAEAYGGVEYAWAQGKEEEEADEAEETKEDELEEGAGEEETGEEEEAEVEEEAEAEEERGDSETVHRGTLDVPSPFDLTTFDRSPAIPPAVPVDRSDADVAAADALAPTDLDASLMWMPGPDEHDQASPIKPRTRKARVIIDDEDEDDSENVDCNGAPPAAAADGDDSDTFYDANEDQWEAPSEADDGWWCDAEAVSAADTSEPAEPHAPRDDSDGRLACVPSAREAAAPTPSAPSIDDLARKLDVGYSCGDCLSDTKTARRYAMAIRNAKEHIELEDRLEALQQVLLALDHCPHNSTLHLLAVGLGHDQGMCDQAVPVRVSVPSRS